MKPQPLSPVAKVALWIGIIICGVCTVMTTVIALVFFIQIFDTGFGHQRGAAIVAFLIVTAPTLLFGWLTRLQYCKLKAGTPKRFSRNTPNPFVCASCGMDAHTRNVSFNRHVGAVILMFHRSVKGHFCRPCISKIFWSWTPLTFFLGWWGMISFFVTPIVLINNLVTYIRSFGMPAGSGIALVFGDSEIAAVSSLQMDVTERVNLGEDVEALANEIAAASGITPAQAFVYIQYRLARPREASLIS